MANLQRAEKFCKKCCEYARQIKEGSIEQRLQYTQLRDNAEGQAMQCLELNAWRDEKTAQAGLEICASCDYSFPAIAEYLDE
ncbi:MAG: hypothetical protein ABIF40_03550 [archaeon]